VVYIVRGADDTLYTGVTNRLDARLLAHNDGKGAKYTRSRRPVVRKGPKGRHGAWGHLLFLAHLLVLRWRDAVVSGCLLPRAGEIEIPVCCAAARTAWFFTAGLVFPQLTR
jgi:hypothetical protein